MLDLSSKEQMYHHVIDVARVTSNYKICIILTTYIMQITHTRPPTEKNGCNQFRCLNIVRYLSYSIKKRSYAREETKTYRFIYKKHCESKNRETMSQ